jgi:hypothetical protein
MRVDVPKGKAQDSNQNDRPHSRGNDCSFELHGFSVSEKAVSEFRISQRAQKKRDRLGIGGLSRKLQVQRVP